MQFSIKQLFLLSIFFFLALSNCKDENTLTRRLDYFYTYLDAQQANQFRQGKVDEVTQYIEKKLLDTTYSNRFYEMKKEEAIDLFSNDDVVEYYYKYFYLNIKSHEK